MLVRWVCPRMGPPILPQVARYDRPAYDSLRPRLDGDRPRLGRTGRHALAAAGAPLGYDDRSIFRADDPALTERTSVDAGATCPPGLSPAALGRNLRQAQPEGMGRRRHQRPGLARGDARGVGAEPTRGSRQIMHEGGASGHFILCSGDLDGKERTGPRTGITTGAGPEEGRLAQGSRGPQDPRRRCMRRVRAKPSAQQASEPLSEAREARLDEGVSIHAALGLHGP